MPYKAFLVGVNTLGLRYAETDARLMQEALQFYGYEVVLAPVTKQDLLTELENLLDRCQKTDTIFFYFSGHGLLKGGKLQLVLGEETAKQANVLNIQDITTRLDNSTANHKLIILDCCHAGAVHTDWHPDFAEMFRVLTASERLEKAKEVDELQASFLTYLLHQALMHRYLEIADRQNHKIYLNELYEWLKNSAKQHNATSSTQVPLPNLLGNQKANFELATVPIEKISPKPTPEKNQRLEQIRKGIQEKRSQFERVIYRGMMEYLLSLEESSHLSGKEDNMLVEMEDFLKNDISDQELIATWKKFSTKESAEGLINYQALFKNLQLGQIAIFLNNEIPQETVEKLNDFFKVGSFNSFAEVCELAEISHGKSLLCDRLREFFHPAPVLLKFYELLAQLPSPIILISSGYDIVLESLFKERNKKYVILSAIDTQGVRMISAEYSDESCSKAYTTETLSEARLLERGYSVIYKIRGDLKMLNQTETQEQVVVLSEQDYFKFSRQIDGLMPNYLVSLLNRRGLWFVGDPPKSWEERLLIYAILEKRQSSQQQKLAFTGHLDHFSNVYLKKKGFEAYEVNLDEWSHQLWAQSGK